MVGTADSVLIREVSLIGSVLTQPNYRTLAKTDQLKAYQFVLQLLNAAVIISGSFTAEDWVHFSAVHTYIHTVH